MPYTSQTRIVYVFLLIKAGNFGQRSGRPRQQNCVSRWIFRSTVLVAPTGSYIACLEISAPTASAASRSLPSYRKKKETKPRLPRHLRNARHPLPVMRRAHAPSPSSPSSPSPSLPTRRGPTPPPPLASPHAERVNAASSPREALAVLQRDAA